MSSRWPEVHQAGPKARPAGAGRAVAAAAVLGALLAACSSSSSPSASAGDASSGSGSPRASTTPATPAGLTVTNLDGLTAWPMPDRMVFSRIQTPDDAQEGMHDVGTTRLGNSSDRTITVSHVRLSGPFRFVSAPSLPATIEPGGHLDLTVRFDATTGSAQGSVLTGKLKITTDAPGADPNPTITLQGWWQKVSEHNLEPSVRQVTQMFGLNLTLPASIYSEGAVRSFSSDEVLSPYWRRLDAAKPASIDEIAVWFTYPKADHVTWFAQGSGKKHPWASSGADQAQTVLPHTGSSTRPATGRITPDGAFGFFVDGQSSDPTMNDQKADRAHGCGAPRCGNHVRAFQLHAADGSVLKGTYLVVEDAAAGSTGYDYNDHVYVVSNVQPATAG